MPLASAFDELNSTIDARIKANEIKIQETLDAVAEKYRRELQANIEYHKHLAKSANETSDPNVALRHNLLAEIYQSLLDRA